MTTKLNTKIIAALAVFAMAFAGFGAVISTEANDAAAGDGDLVLIIDDVYLENTEVLTLIADLAHADEITSVAVEYVAILDDDFEEKITVLTKDYYDAMKTAGLIKGMTVTFKAADLADDDVMQGLKVFTSVEVNKVDEIIGGVSTKITLDNTILTKKVTYELIGTEEAASALVIAVAAAVAEVEEKYAGYSSPEDVIKAIDAAVAGLYTQAELDKAVEDAKKTVVDNNVWMYVSVVLIIVLIALAGYIVFKFFKKPAKKQETA